MRLGHCLYLWSNYSTLLCLWLLLGLCVAEEGGREGDERRTESEAREPLTEDSADPEISNNATKEEVCWRQEQNPLYLYKTRHRCSMYNTSESQITTSHVMATPSPLSRPSKPICEINKGCTPPLQCLNLSTVNDPGLTPFLNQGKVVEINSSQLEYLLDSPKFTNACMVLMFFAKWCQYSVNFAPVYNALGHSFSQLPVLALDFGDQDP